jgi:NAD(P) transhydrogenase subunit alpha
MLDAKSGEFKIDREDEIVDGTIACTGGEVIKKA